MGMFFVAGIGIAVFIELLLISKRDKSASDQILTAWMFLILVHLFLSYLFFTQDIFDVPFLLGMEQPFPLLHGVFLYVYVASLTKQLPENRKVLILHLLPAMAIYAYIFSFFFLPADQKIEVYRSRGAGHELFNAIRSYAIVFSGIFYVIWSAALLRKHRHNIRDQFSDLEKVNLQWLQILTLGMGGVWFLVIFFSSENLVLAGMVVFVFLIGFFGVRQAEIFAPGRPMAGGSKTRPKYSEPESTEAISPPASIPSGNEQEQEDPKPELSARSPHDQSIPGVNDQKQKYSKSGLTEEASEKLHQRLRQLMSEQALYKKSDLSINDLSSKLGVHPNYLSQIINQKEKKNFYDFVNTYRIEEFKRLAAMPRYQQFTLLSLAYDCGFSSKSSFNRYFKEATGQTPSQYFTTLTRADAISPRT